MSHYQSKSYNHTYRINSYVHSGASRVDCCVCIDCFYVLIVVYVLSCTCWMIFPPYEYICTAHLCKFSVMVGDTFMLEVYPAYHSVNWTSSLVSATATPVDCFISTANTIKMMVSGTPSPSSDMSISCLHSVYCCVPYSPIWIDVYSGSTSKDAYQLAIWSYHTHQYNTPCWLLYWSVTQPLHPPIQYICSLS